MKSGKCRKICLTNDTQSVTHYITPLVINDLGTNANIHTHANMQTKAISRNQAYLV